MYIYRQVFELVSTGHTKRNISRITHDALHARARGPFSNECIYNTFTHVLNAS